MKARIRQEAYTNDCKIPTPHSTKKRSPHKLMVYDQGNMVFLVGQPKAAEVVISSQHPLALGKDARGDMSDEQLMTLRTAVSRINACTHVHVSGRGCVPPFPSPCDH